MNIVWWSVLLLAVGFAFGMLPSAVRGRLEILGTIEFLATALAVVLVGATVFFTSQQLEIGRQAERTSNFSRLMEAMDKNQESRILALQGFVDYGRSYEEARPGLLRQLATRARFIDRRLKAGLNAEITAADEAKLVVDGGEVRVLVSNGQDTLVVDNDLDEFRMTLGALRRVSQMEYGPADPLAYDMAHVDLRGTPMVGLVAESGFFVETIFSGSLSGSEFTCGSVGGATFTGSLDGAIFDGVDLTHANFMRATEIEAATFKDVYWKEGAPPLFPGDLPSDVEPRLDDVECRKSHGLK